MRLNKSSVGGKGVNSQAFFNILSSLVLSGINFITIPVFTRVLGTANYGRFAVYHSWLLIVACFIDLCCRQGLATAKYQFGEENYYKYRSSTLTLGACFGIACILLTVLLQKPLSGFMRYSPALTVLLAVTAYAYSVVEFAKQAWIYEKQAQKNFVVSTALSLMTVALSLLLLPRYDEDTLYIARTIGFCAPYVVVGAVLWAVMFKKSPAGFRREYWRYALVLGTPIIFHLLSQNILTQSDRVMMQRFRIDDDIIGIYSFFYTFSGIVTTVLNALNVSWCPFYYDYLHAKSFDILKVKCRNYMQMFTIICCGFLLVSREVSRLFADESFQSGIDVLPILTVGIFFIFMYQFPVNFEFFHKKTQIIAGGTVCAGLLNIGLNALLIPPYGMYGAAVATMISYVALFAGHYFIATRLLEARFHIRLTDYLPWLGCVLAGVAAFYLLAPLWPVRWAMGAGLGVFLIVRIVRRREIF